MTHSSERCVSVREANGEKSDAPGTGKSGRCSEGQAKKDEAPSIFNIGVKWDYEQSRVRL